MEQAGCPLQKATKLLSLDGMRFNMQPGLHEAEGKQAPKPQVSASGKNVVERSSHVCLELQMSAKTASAEAS